MIAPDPPRAADISLWQLLRGFHPDPLERWTRMRVEQGPVARYRLGLGDTYFITHPDGARRVLQDNAANYGKNHPSYAALKRLLGNGLLTSDGTFWLRQRRLAQPAFHRERIAKMGELAVEASLETAQRWERQERVSLLHEMSQLTLRVVCRALFGAELNVEGEEVSQAWNVLNTQLVERFNRRRVLPPILPTAYDRAFRQARATLFRVVDGLIAHKRRTVGNDLLSMLIEARDADTGEQMSDAQLRDEVVTMLLAGHETTSAALTWAWALLDAHPRAREALRNELAAVPMSEPRQLRITRAVFDEALRLYPPAYVMFRRAKEDDVVCGYRVRKGGAIAMSPMIFHRHPDFWENPDVFDPTRWLDAEAEKRRPRFAFMPFSGGPRQCIGNAFAQLEGTLVLATLARRFEPKLLEPGIPKPEYRVTLRPQGGAEARPCPVPPARRAEATP